LVDAAFCSFKNRTQPFSGCTQLGKRLQSNNLRQCQEGATSIAPCFTVSATSIERKG
jgi:hypothetical protein